MPNIVVPSCTGKGVVENLVSAQHSHWCTTFSRISSPNIVVLSCKGKGVVENLDRNEQYLHSTVIGAQHSHKKRKKAEVLPWSVNVDVKYSGSKLHGYVGRCVVENLGSICTAQSPVQNILTKKRKKGGTNKSEWCKRFQIGPFGKWPVFCWHVNKFTTLKDKLVQNYNFWSNWLTDLAV